MEESLKWLQASHFFDVIEERVHDGRCGFPLCTKQLEKAQYLYLKKKTASLESISELLGGDLPIACKNYTSSNIETNFAYDACLIPYPYYV